MQLEVCIFIPIINDDIFETPHQNFFFNVTTRDRDVILNPHSVIVSIVDDESEFQKSLLLSVARWYGSRPISY